MKKRSNFIDRLIGVIIFSTFGIGLLAIVIGFLAMLLGEWIGAGITLIAAALAFGLLANAILRD